MLSTRNHKRKFKRTSIQQAVRDGLARTEQWLAQSESAREQQATQLAELNNGLNYSNSTARSARAPHMRRRPPTPPPPTSDPLQCGRCSTAHSSVHVNIGSLPTISLADPIQKRLAHYFESGERRNWSATDFVTYLDTLYADGTTVGEARLQLHRFAATGQRTVHRVLAGPSKDPEGDTAMTGVASAGFAGKGKARAQWVSKDVWELERAAVVGPVLALR
ncbi:hypothetical protein E4U35_007371, partial [Claviceps purpurea]